MSRKVTILGMGPSAYERKHDIEKYCEGTEIWSLNNAYLTFPTLRAEKKFARFFELHAWNYLRTWKAGQTEDGKEVDHFGELSQLGCPVFTGQPIPLVNEQVVYPFEAVFDHFGHENIYFLGSPSLMLALAIYEHDTGHKIEYIQSWGIDTSDPSHAQQRTSWAYWTGKAIDRGIKIGGTMLAYQNEYEKDAGLNGLREHLRAELKPKQQR